jgi:NADPH:quinone reductase-like Zn-dependent oxidoreductase
MMKAIEYVQYGGPEVFQLQEAVKPVPKAHEVLVQIFASTVTSADIMMRKGKPFIGRMYLGMKKPKRTILGFDFAGEIVATGEEVSKFKVGDRVFGGTTTLGCYAEFLCVSESDVITTIPKNISYEEAAPVSGSGITVINFLQGKAKIRKGQQVLINGASGALGTYAIQFAKHMGAEVTGVCSTTNVGLVKSLGADHVIDYTKRDFTQNGKLYDIIFDTVGKRNFSQCRHSLSEKGIYLSSVMDFALFMQIIRTSFSAGKKAKTSSTGLLPVNKRMAYFMELKDLMAKGKIKTVIDNEYPLCEMAAAHRYVENGHKRGNTIIRL